MKQRNIPKLRNICSVLIEKVLSDIEKCCRALNRISVKVVKDLWIYKTFFSQTQLNVSRAEFSKDLLLGDKLYFLNINNTF